MEEVKREENQQMFKVLEALKKASQDLKTKSNYRQEDVRNSSAIKALLELEIEAENILSNDPNLYNLFNHVSQLKTLVKNLQNLQGHHHSVLRSFLTRRGSQHEISRVAESIETEIQAWIDREIVENLVRVLTKSLVYEDDEEDEKVKLLTQFENRILQGFNRDLQDLILKWKVFNSLETVLSNPKSSKRIREKSALAIGGLVQFNKDVFVGEVLMGSTIKTLISMSSISSIQVLCSLIRSIKSPLLDELESNGEIVKIISLLSSEDSSITVMAMDCVLEIGYFGRKEAIEAMLEEGLVKKLVDLQRSEMGGYLIDMGRLEDEERENREVCVGGVEIETREKKKESRERKYFKNHPFASCVARFWIQLEVGEGLRQREKRAFKIDILKRVREACVCDSDGATILAEVLWGSSP